VICATRVAATGVTPAECLKSQRPAIASGQIVDLEVAGSNPVSHPRQASSGEHSKPLENQGLARLEGVGIGRPGNTLFSGRLFTVVTPCRRGVCHICGSGYPPGGRRRFTTACFFAADAWAYTANVSVGELCRANSWASLIVAPLSTTAVM
jgi:hypothetical protein